MKLPTKKNWEEIEEAFDTLDEDKTERQINLTNIWLCDALDYLGFKGAKICMVLNPKHRLEAQTWWNEEYIDSLGNMFELGESKDRSIFAGFMAAMGTQGFKNFYEWCEKNMKLSIESE